jgi:hypothetical protein
MSKLASQDFEIPMPQERKFRYRFFEALPGILSWTVLTSPFWLGFLNVSLAALLMLLYLMLWFVRAAALNVRGIQSFRRLDQHSDLMLLKLSL